MSSAEAGEYVRYAPTLLGIARASVEHGLRVGAPLEVDLGRYPDPLGTARASFVTLHVSGELQGCMGALEPRCPLVTDVATNAYGAAFRDPRFEPLQSGDLERLGLHVSVLSELQPLEVGSEEELIARLRPKIDGLVLREGSHVGTFLPAVWESLSDPGLFVRELKRKAGLPADYWSPRVEIQLYTVESVA